MKRLPITILFLVVLGEGCAVSTSVSLSTPNKTGTPIETEEFVQAIAPTRSPEILIPVTTSICPEYQEVSIDKLNLSDNLLLLLLPGGIRSATPEPGKPMSISHNRLIPTPIIEDAIFEYSVSPDYKWIYFTRPENDNGYPTLWISSLNGNQQWPVIDLIGTSYAGYPSWVSEEEIFIIGSPYKSDLSSIDPWEYMPFININPFTLEQHSLTYLDQDINASLFYYGALNIENHALGMFGRLNRVDFIYDYELDSSTPVFSWLEVIDPFTQATKPIWVDSNGKFVVTVANTNGIDVATNLDIQSANDDKQYFDVMKRLILPPRFLPSSVLGVVPNSNLIALRRFDMFNTNESNKWFYTLDPNTQIITDYCLALDASLIEVKFSPDGRFAAFSLEDFNSDAEQERHYVVILNLENGDYSYVKGYVLVGWGISSP